MKVTIVIPTRERAETLGSTLQTCLGQDYQPLEILVSDNFSQDHTKKVVESFSDRRIRYLNTGKRMSMSGNWEFALSHVKEGFVTFVGDDDGLLPDSINNGMEIIKKFSLGALSWKKVEYTWPSYPISGLKNLLVIPQLNYLLRFSSEKAIRDCSSFFLWYNYCPCVYNSLVDFSILEKIRNKTGIFFHSVIPDVYSGFAISSELKSYFYSMRPFSINGASGQSNGTSFRTYFKNKDDVNNPTVQFMKENDLPLHQKMPVLVPGSVTSSVLEPLLQANDHCFGGTLKINFPMAIRRIFMEISPLDPIIYQEAVRQLKLVFGPTSFGSYVKKCEKRFQNHPCSDSPIIIEQCNAFEKILDVSNNSVKNVYEASLFANAELPRYSIPRTIQNYSRFSLLLFSLGPKIAKKIPSKIQGLFSLILKKWPI